MATSLYSPDFLKIFNANRDTGGSPKAFPSPADWRDQWMYFLMVDRFNNSKQPPAHAPFDDPNFFGFQGGNLASIQDQLSYIHKLGAGAIWISPILKNVPFQQGTYHGYGICDFLHVDPRFARDPNNADAEFRALVDAAHELGMYIILDIVLNHTGDVFAYLCDAGESNCIRNQGAQADFRSSPRSIQWRDARGTPHADWTDIATIPQPFTDVLVWPSELHNNNYFRRQGMPGPSDNTVGDFASLKQFRTDRGDVQQHLIRCFQYLIARFDVDGFRIDTLRYLKNGLPLLFGNAIREYALSIGKKNFFTFGEVFVGDAEQEIARFIGRNTSAGTDLVGVDAALDYPLYFDLKPVVKGFAPPSDLVKMYLFRKQVEQNVLSSHGDATRYFITFLDNHDVKERIRYADPRNPTGFDDQVTLGLACLYSLPGIPCLYYGTEQGLHGSGVNDPAVREALWGGPGFNENSAYFQHISQIASMRRQCPALRYGRFYFRPISGDKQHFGISGSVNGTISFSRILMDQEIVLLANTDSNAGSTVFVIIDTTLNNPGDQFRILYSNKNNRQSPGSVIQLAAGTVQVQETDGSTGTGPVSCFQVTLGPLEVQVLGK